MARRHIEGGCREFQQQATVQRRDFLRVGGLGVLGLSLPALWQAEARASNYGAERTTARAKSCIFLFLSGGPSQLETFDPKPEATAEHRGDFKPIQSRLPGVLVGEHLPDVARQLQHCALVRTAWHKYGGHFGGHRYALTGHAAPGSPDQAARPDDKPGIIGLAAKHYRSTAHLPTLMMPWLATDQGSGASGGMSAGTLGKQFDPVQIEVDTKSAERGDPPVFRIPEFALQPGLTAARVDKRRELLALIEEQRGAMIDSATQSELDGLYARAYDLLTSPKIKDGFELNQEPVALRDKYGMNAFGQSCLLARRQVERGARFIQVNFSRTVTQKSYGWDTHGKGYETMTRELLPKLNAGLSTLIADLHDRGMLKDTLVVAMGEFGRTPKIKKDGGRDHWPQCYSLLLAGGGVHGGLVHGVSDRNAAYPKEDPVEARQILLTIMTLLGIPTVSEDVQGRVAPLFPGSDPIERLYT
ncbi:MAG: DUF1501 domain-containing protein [Gemmataceae bacterium]